MSSTLLTPTGVHGRSKISERLSGRRPDIDWRRVIAAALPVPFHTARIFDIWEQFYVKDSELTPVLIVIIALLNPCQMPLLFVLGGASTWFALRKRTAREYLGERMKRLGVPFVFGMLMVAPPHAYVASVSHDGNPGSILDFYGHYFQRNRMT